MRSSRMLFALALTTAHAHAIIRLPLAPAQVTGNPAERLLSMPIENSVYDPATRCSRARPSVAHRNHIHIGLTRAGAARRTSFWSLAR